MAVAAKASRAVGRLNAGEYPWLSLGISAFLTIARRGRMQQDPGSINWHYRSIRSLGDMMQSSEGRSKIPDEPVLLLQRSAISLPQMVGSRLPSTPRGGAHVCAIPCC